MLLQVSDAKMMKNEAQLNPFLPYSQTLGDTQRLEPYTPVRIGFQMKELIFKKY